MSSFWNRSPRSLLAGPHSSLVLSVDDAIALSKRILSMSSADSALVAMTHSYLVTTRIANGQVLSGDDGDTLDVGFRCKFGVRSYDLHFNQLDESTIRAGIAQLERYVKQEPWTEEDVLAFPIDPQPIPKVDLWHDTSASAILGPAYDVVPDLLIGTQRAGFSSAGFLGVSARTRTIVHSGGLIAGCCDTDVDCSVTTRTPDNKSSGWAGQATRDWAKLNVRQIAERAIDMGTRAKNPVAIEPGRQTTILTPAAFGQLAIEMAYAYTNTYVDNKMSPFTKSLVLGGNRIGMRVFDERINIRSDINDPDGGYAPFLQFQSQAPGYPFNSMTWVEHGVLKTLAYDIGEALRIARPNNPAPESVRIDGGPSSIDEMIAQCEQGIFVNRLSNIELVDPASGMMTGVTRDGCFLIKKGKILRSVKNFRFLDSPFMMLNRLVTLGATERAPIMAKFNQWLRKYDWPAPPVIVPPIMVRDFNLVSLSDAV